MTIAPEKSPTRFILTYILLSVGSALFYPLAIVLVIVAYRDIRRHVTITRLVRQAEPEVRWVEHLAHTRQQGNFTL